MDDAYVASPIFLGVLQLGFAAYTNIKKMLNYHRYWEFEFLLERCCWLLHCKREVWDFPRHFILVFVRVRDQAIRGTVAYSVAGTAGFHSWTKLIKHGLELGLNSWVLVSLFLKLKGSKQRGKWCQAGFLVAEFFKHAPKEIKNSLHWPGWVSLHADVYEAPLPNRCSSGSAQKTGM